MFKEKIEICRQQFKMFIFSLGLVTMTAACGHQSQSGQVSPIPIESQSQQASQNEITNGIRVPEASLESLATVALYIAKGKNAEGVQLSNFCTGTLIRSDLILTAAHCISDFSKDLGIGENLLAQNILVGFGRKVFTSIDADSRSKLRQVRTLIVHPKYVAGSVTKVESASMYDIALIRLNEKAPATAKVASLAPNSFALERGQYIRLVGFGVTDGVTDQRTREMMEVDVQIQNPEFSPTQFTYSVVNGKGSCSGDSGGPAYYRRGSGELMLLGVTSWGDRLCQEIGAYTSVPYFIDWIRATASANF